MTYTLTNCDVPYKRSFKIMKHIHETWAFLVKSGILRTSVYNVYGSQNEFVEHITRVFILRMRSRGQNGPLRLSIVFAVASIHLIPMNIMHCRYKCYLLHGSSFLSIHVHVVVHWTSNETYHLFRVALTTIHHIKINHLWIQMNYSTPY